MKRLYFSIVTLALSLLLFSSCHDCPPTENHDVTVDAGINQIIQLPADSATLHGTVLNGLTSPMTYAWTQLSGPGTAIIGNSSGTITGVYSLVAGTYIFQFAATNTYGNTVTVRINNPQVIGNFVAPKTGADTDALAFSGLLTGAAAVLRKRKDLLKLIFT